MPVYNAVTVVKETIDSILGQTFTDFELIITDDNSSDKTSKIINEIKDDRVNFFQYKKNVGYPRNLERCINKCSNEIVFLMAQDDILAQGTLELFTDFLKKIKMWALLQDPIIGSTIMWRNQLEPKNSTIRTKIVLFLSTAILIRLLKYSKH